MPTPLSTEEKEPRFILSLPLILGVGGIWLSFGFFPLLFGTGETARGTFGDMFGMVNALFSGLAFAGVLNALKMQRDELALQRRALNESTSAQKDSAKALKKQVWQSAQAAQMNGLAALLSQATEEVNVLRTRTDRNAASGNYGNVSLAYKSDLDAALAYRENLKKRIEALSAQMIDESNS